MRETFKYRLFTTRRESELLGVQLGEACRLYNAALEERRGSDESLSTTTTKRTSLGDSRRW
jgi:hypothetical protein